MRNDIVESFQGLNINADILMESFRNPDWDGTPDDPILGVAGCYEQRDIAYGDAETLREWREELNERLDDPLHKKMSCSRDTHEDYLDWKRLIQDKDINTRPSVIYALAPLSCLLHMGW